MAFVALNDVLGEVDLNIIDIAGPGYQNLVAGTGSGRQNFLGQTVAGYDVNLGGGEFMYLQYSATIQARSVCEVSPTVSGGFAVLQANKWLGTQSTVPLCVALNDGTVGQYGWFQVQGAAIATVAAAGAGSAAFWQANGIISTTVVAGKQMLGARFASATGPTIGQGSSAVVLPGTQAVIYIDRPLAQGQIT